ncbi:MAG: hypothetical protein J6C86_00940 [Bacteroidaceae bacterium]|nr:hypothetical protein [Bacteroidaceae bacterium]
MYAYTVVASDDQVEVTVAQDEFKAIETDSLPQTIKDAVAENYKDQTIKAAYVKETEGVKTYKVTLTDAETKTSDVLFNEKGEILPVEEQK